MQLHNTRHSSALRAESMSVFPTHSSVQDVIALAESKLPITSKNEMYSLLMTFQNTLLKEVSHAG